MRIYFKEYLGFFIFFLSHLIVALELRLWIKRKTDLLVNHLIITIFASYGFFIYMYSKNLFWSLLNKNFYCFFTVNINFFIGVMGLSLIIQYYAVSKTKSFFPRIVVPALINIVISVGLLPLIGYGLINVVWFLILVGMQSGLVFITIVFDGLIEMIPTAEKCRDDKDKKELLDVIREEMNRYLKIGIQIFLALGASIGVSMSILFNKGKEAWMDNVFQVQAFSIIMAFGFVGLCLLIMLIKPYMENFVNVRYYYSKVLGKSHLLNRISKRRIRKSF